MASTAVETSKPLDELGPVDYAAPFASAARRAGGQLIANGRIPFQAIIASIEADEALATEGV
jgi:hypothetical protein